ncbi:MAG: MazG family protein [Intrasporangium sp.]|uniref:MazG family protein n=1 Tax=Intrasporangium sp. TaxID=1925024 RepID=UPI0026477592|nr:MazG family protein [Intrasporangium sp.]MDN5795508.1 MazG family protein [Intrasporangium sp.]
MTGRLTLLLTTPRVAPGLLTRDAWHALESAKTILARQGEYQAGALVEAGLDIDSRPSTSVPALARELVDAARRGEILWIGSADGDPGLTDAIAAEVSRLTDPPEVELLVGSHDVQGARLLDVVAVMDRLRSPGGCPWDAEQTPRTLVPYLLEEAYEAIEAIESGDPAQVREELGDLLLQVAFQSRVAEEDPDTPFDIDDVAGGLVDKLVRRHPHVFGSVEAATPEDVEANWEAIKATEKADRSHPLEGIPQSLPALARADKAISRLERAGLAERVAVAAAGDDLGARLLALVREARGVGVDAEATLRAALRRLAG